MATGGESDTEIESGIDVSGFMRAFNADDDDNTGSVSMFCKACLHPYRGEEKSGTIVLRCEHCGQTDTILEQEVGSLDPQEWIGNLMMNRFMQVVKEQSDLSTTLLDPYFAEDDYQRVCLALSEYTYRIDKLAQNLLDFANDNGLLSGDENDRLGKWLNDNEEVRNVDIKPVRVTRAIMELHDILNVRTAEISKRNNQDEMNVPSDAEDVANDAGTVAESSESVTNVSENMNDETKPKTLCDGATCSGIDPENIVSQINGYLDQIGPSIINLVEGLILKHSLSENVMYNIQQSILARERGQPLERREPEPENTANHEAETVETESDEEPNAKVTEEDNDANKVDENISETPGDDVVDDEQNTIDPSESFTQLGIKPEVMKKEVYDVLEKKFLLRFGTEDNKSNSTNLYNKFAEEDQAKEVEKSAGEDTGEAVNSAEGSINANIPMENFNPAEHIKMNIYTLSTEFVRELHRIKQNTFADRKNRAMVDLHERCCRVKREMENVEVAVVEELNLAYARKMKKVENQVKQIDAKQEQLEEAERLLEFYARTGQQEKLAELMRQINLHHEKN